MSFKEDVSNKILNKSSSYTYYKDNYYRLNEKIDEYEKNIDSLTMQLDEKTSQNESLAKQLDIKTSENHDLTHDLDIKTSQNEFLIRHLAESEDGFIFSIIMAIYNTEKYLNEAIDSIINQSFPFDKIQVILIDDGSTDSSGEICRKYHEKYPDNIVHIKQENQGQSHARNNGLDYAEGKYLNFLDSDDKLERDTLNEIYYHFLKFGDEIDVITIPRYNFDKVNKPLILAERYAETRIVDIEREYDFPQVAINAAFIRKDALCGNFDTELFISEDSLLLNKTILGKGKFGAVGNVRYMYRKRRESDSTINTKKTRKEYFSQRMTLYFKELIDFSIEKCGHVPKYVQTVLVYDLRWLFRDKTEIGILDKEETDAYYGHIYDVLQYIDEDIILSQDFKDDLKEEMINFKNGMDF